MKTYESSAKTIEEAISAGLEKLGVSISDVTIDDLAIGQNDYISVAISVDADAENVGGINLFGEHFGDHPQALILRLGYHMKNAT